jgi:hypothetical protein
MILDQFDEAASQDRVAGFIEAHHSIVAHPVDDIPIQYPENAHGIKH